MSGVLKLEREPDIASGWRAPLPVGLRGLAVPAGGIEPPTTRRAAQAEPQFQLALSGILREQVAEDLLAGLLVGDLGGVGFLAGELDRTLEFLHPGPGSAAPAWRAWPR
jgi:hypothetical protein